MDIDPVLLDKITGKNKEFKKLYEEHQSLKSRVEELNKKRFLTPEQETEKKNIQKQKLKAKDRLTEIMNQYQAQAN